MNQDIPRPRRAARWPLGHFLWAYAGRPEFEGRAASFLAEGQARGERQVVITDDPRRSLWPQDLLRSGDLVVLGTDEAYGPTRIVDPVSLGATLEALLADALRLGYTGLRIAGDNTRLVEGPDRLAAWLAWEGQVDVLMQSTLITGLCAFDLSRIEPGALRALLASHSVVMRSSG
ncbi:MEDS domain-containing protein [Sinomonas soli]